MRLSRRRGLRCGDGATVDKSTEARIFTDSHRREGSFAEGAVNDGKQGAAVVHADSYHAIGGSHVADGKRSMRPRPTRKADEAGGLSVGKHLYSGACGTCHLEGYVVARPLLAGNSYAGMCVILQQRWQRPFSRSRSQPSSSIQPS